MSLQKRKSYRNKAITQGAKLVMQDTVGQPCKAEFPGCTGGWEDLAFRHFNAAWAGKGGSQKADDCAGFYGCQHCENIYDGSTQNTRDAQLFHADEDYYVLRAYYRTIREIIDQGILK